jgi:biotin--protein ligase
VWTSPAGCLMFSFNTRCAAARRRAQAAARSRCADATPAAPGGVRRSVRAGRTLPFLQYVVTLALVEAVQALAREALAAAGVDAAAAPEPAGAPPPPPGVPPRTVGVRIKWPNDVYAGGAKLAGVLCGSTFADGAFCVTVGVGVNVANAAPTTCLDAVIGAAAAAAGAAAPPPPLRPARLLAEVLSRYESLEARFVADGFAPLERAYLYHWLHSRQEVTLEEPAPAAAGEAGGAGAAGVRRVALTIQGLTHTGYLLAVDALGERFELHPDGNSLDFFQGLVRKKLP